MGRVSPVVYEGEAEGTWRREEEKHATRIMQWRRSKRLDGGVEMWLRCRSRRGRGRLVRGGEVVGGAARGEPDGPALGLRQDLKGRSRLPRSIPLIY